MQLGLRVYRHANLTCGAKMSGRENRLRDGAEDAFASPLGIDRRIVYW